MHSETFAQWIAQGGEYVLWLAGMIGGFGVIGAVVYKFIKFITAPAKKATEQSVQGDKELHERVDGIEETLIKVKEYVKSDFESIKEMRRDNNTQVEAIAKLTEGVFLIIQHLVTDDHIADMEKWMRDQATLSVRLTKEEDNNGS